MTWRWRSGCSRRLGLEGIGPVSGDVPILPYGTPTERAVARDRVAEHLSADGLVVYPTETVYGLGCALRPRALGRLTELKGARPFLLLIEDDRQTPELGWGPAARRLAERFWPGPVTLALPAAAGAFPSEVVGPDGAVAVRVSPHPAVAALLAAAGGPVTSTSANPPGEPPPHTAAAAAAALAGVPMLLVLDGGALPPGPPSTIVRCEGRSARVLREGAIDLETIAATVEVE